jgi:hypothetical protein
MLDAHEAGSAFLSQFLYEESLVLEFLRQADYLFPLICALLARLFLPKLRGFVLRGLLDFRPQSMELL